MSLLLLAIAAVFKTGSNVDHIETQPLSFGSREISIGHEDARTLSSIILSCLFTLLVCMVFCIRQDLSRISNFRRKLNISFWMLMCPEFVIYWAFCQWLEARAILKKYKTRGWTLTHGFLMVMGGFIVVKEGQPLQVLCMTRFSKLVDMGAIKFPSITKNDIDAESKTHPILTGIVFLQSGWFITNCIARMAYGLPITQLELMTLVLVVMNGLLLIFWWHKPLDIHTHIDLVLNISMDAEIVNVDAAPTGDRMDLDFGREKSFGKKIKQIVSPRASKEPEERSLAIFKAIFITPISKVFTDYVAIIFRVDSSDIQNGALEVPLFYARDTVSQLGYRKLSTTSLGALPSVAHYFMSFTYFPTPRDASVWKISSIALICFSGWYIAGFILVLETQRLAGRFPGHPISIFLTAISTLVAMLLIAFVAVLIPARVALFVQSFLCMRSLPSGTLETVRWADYIPHFS